MGATNAAELEKAWRERQERWQRQRLLVVRLVGRLELNAEQIAAAAGVARSTVFRYLDTFPTSGMTGLLAREHKGGNPPTLGAADQAAFLEQLREGQFRRAKEAQAWIKARTQRTLALSRVYSLLGKVGGAICTKRSKSMARKRSSCSSLKRSIRKSTPPSCGKSPLAILRPGTYVIIADQTGFHLRVDDLGVPANIRLLPLPPYSPELNPVEKLGDLEKDPTCNQLFTALRPLEDAILAEL